MNRLHSNRLVSFSDYADTRPRNFFSIRDIEKTLGCDTDLLIGFILAFESLTLDQCKYFLDFLRRTVWSEIIFVGYGASNLGTISHSAVI